MKNKTLKFSINYDIDAIYKFDTKQDITPSKLNVCKIFAEEYAKTLKEYLETSLRNITTETSIEVSFDIDIQEDIQINGLISYSKDLDLLKPAVYEFIFKHGLEGNAVANSILIGR